MQTKAEIEKWYEKKDPWGYEKHPDDIKRRNLILYRLRDLAWKLPDLFFERALDIGAGEGFITQDLPAGEVYAIEWSDRAAARLPVPIERIDKPDGMYDLIIATGVLYDQYDNMQIQDWIEGHASGIVLTCNIKSWERNYLDATKIIHEEEFPYREYTQHLVIYNYGKKEEE